MYVSYLYVILWGASLVHIELCFHAFTSSKNITIFPTKTTEANPLGKLWELDPGNFGLNCLLLNVSHWDRSITKLWGNWISSRSHNIGMIRSHLAIYRFKLWSRASFILCRLWYNWFCLLKEKKFGIWFVIVKTTYNTMDSSCWFSLNVDFILSCYT